MLTVARLGAFSAFLSSCTWAIGTAVYSRLARQHTAFAVNLARSLFALPLFTIGAFIAAGSFSGGIADFRAISLSSVLWFFLSTVASYGLGDAIFLMSTQSLGVPGALAIASCYPIWTAAVGWLFQGQVLSGFQILGLGLTVAGVVVVILFAPARAQVIGAGSEGTGEVVAGDAAREAGAKAGFPLVGVALAILTSIFWTVNGYSVFRGGQGVSLFAANSVRMAFAIAISPLMGRLLAPGAPLLLPARVVRGSIWIFVIEAFGGSAFFVYGLCHSPLAIGATLSALAPVLSVPVALAGGLERFSPWRTAGVVVAVVGLRLLVG